LAQLATTDLKPRVEKTQQESRIVKQDSRFIGKNSPACDDFLAGIAMEFRTKSPASRN
jgi:hypothetical protein